ncbi:hypothetical protein L6164_016629 [Bauhinia variegata]|uniref:Uncharacterized protein n=1 Tax=Bauhinia variegata TaxID=167791 RepID=A0ACB9NPY7_BAUVA|nr:hypothetical protein L6164_016629 [Bauhinia variegata]
MGKKRGGAKGISNSTSGFHISLREEATGKVQRKAGTNVKSILKLEHLKKLALWASDEASIPNLAAFYGHYLATVGEAIGEPPDPSLVTCQRCETILHPGLNCTVRIEKNRAKAKHRRKKAVNVAQKNHVVYKCHFCSHQNLKRGTLKGYMKGICPSEEKSSKPRQALTQESAGSEKDIRNVVNETDELALQTVTSDNPIDDGPATPSVTSVTALSEGQKSQKRKRNRSASKKGNEPANIPAQVAGANATSASGKRRKSWTSLKEIAQGSEHGNRKLKIPFFL